MPQRGSVDWDFPTNVLDVVEMGRYGALGWLKRPGKTERDAAMHALEKVGMASFAKRQISQLSGGQQQRVFLARALAQDADIYLMDEPFQGVDATTERAIVELLRELRAAGKTVVAVHHDSANGARVFRLGNPPERAQDRQWPVSLRSTPTKICASPTAAWWPSSIIPAMVIHPIPWGSKTTRRPDRWSTSFAIATLLAVPDVLARSGLRLHACGPSRWARR